MILELRHIHFGFSKENLLLKDLSLQLEAGKIYALMGGNGSGKTTLFNLVTGFYRPQQGEILFRGKDIALLPPYKINRAGIGRTFQDLRLIGNLTVRENIEIAFQGRLSDVWHKALLPGRAVKEQEGKLLEITVNALRQFHLEEVQDNLASEISFGQQKLLNIACCVVNGAALLLLDEPVAGVNPVFGEQLTEVLKELKKSGTTILLIEHNTEFIREVADRIFFMMNGSIKAYDTVELLKQDMEVINAYM